MANEVENKIKEEIIREKIKRIREIYAEFEKELNGLRKESDVIINEILKRIDEEKIKEILKTLQ